MYLMQFLWKRDVLKTFCNSKEDSQWKCHFVLSAKQISINLSEMIHALKYYKNNRRALLLKIPEKVRHFKLEGCPITDILEKDNLN